MLKKLLLIIALLIPSLAWGQSTTVSGQVTDAGGQSWNNGTVVATFVPGNPPFPIYVWTGGTFGPAQQTVRGTLGATGAYSISVPSNTAISPGGTTWQIVVTSATTPQFTSTQNLTITGGTQTVNFTPSAILTGAAPGVVVYSTAEISTANIGSTIYVIGAGLQSCSAVTGFSCTTWGGSSGGSGPGTPGSVPQGTINPANFGVTMNAQMCRDTNAKFTTTTSVTCTTANFINSPAPAGDLNKIIFGTCCGLQGGQFHQLSTLILPQGTITAVNSATNVTVSLAGTATTCAAGAAGCLIIWGTDDTAGWNSTWTAATGTAGHCYGIQMGSGMSLFQSALFLSTVCNTGITGASSQGGSINGLGYKTSQFVVTPNFNTASCTGTSISLGSVVCFGPSIGVQFANLGIWGGEYGNNTNFSGKVFVNLGVDSYLTNVLFAGLSNQSGSFLIGVNSDASGQTTNTMIVDGFGFGNNIGTIGMCAVSAGNYNAWVQPFCGNTAGPALTIASGARLTAYNGGWGGNKTVSTQPDVFNNGLFIDNDGVFFGCTTACANLAVNTGSTTKLRGSNLIGNGNAAASALFFNNAATAKVYALGSIFTGGAANLDVTFGTVMGTFYDQGGNTYAHTNTAITPTCAMTTGGGTGPACTLVAGSTNEKGTVRMTPGTTPGTSGTITLTFAGTFTGGTSTTPSCQFNYANTGTGTWTTITAQPILTTRSSTTPVFTWAATVAAASTYDTDYQCTAR